MQGELRVYAMRKERITSLGTVGRFRVFTEIATVIPTLERREGRATCFCAQSQQAPTASARSE
jgi:hypothetical protein